MATDKLPDNDEDRYTQPVEFITLDTEHAPDGIPAGTAALAQQLVLDGADSEVVAEKLTGKLMKEAISDYDLGLVDESEIEQASKEEDKEEVTAELKRWRRVAIRCAKTGREQRTFESQIISADIMNTVRDKIAKADLETIIAEFAAVEKLIGELR